MLNFYAGAFAVAGLVAAAGPILIHLLNRRRFRVVEWAAMDFLREAMQRNRRVLQMRDLLLLLLRVLAVALVGFALARPFFTTADQDLWFRFLWTGLAVAGTFGLAIWAVLSRSRTSAIVGGVGSLLLAVAAFWGIGGIRARVADDGQFASTQPVHAVLVLDNSASMGYEVLDGGNLLGRAKEKALAFVDELPPDSRVSVLPLCGSPTSFGFDAHRSREDVREAIERIPVVDRGGAAARATNVIDLAEQACQRAPELPSKRVVFLSDQQAGNWPADALGAESLDGLPELQVVQVTPSQPSNVWVSDFAVQDGIADTETPATFIATIRLQGRSPVSDVSVSLTVDGAPVAARTIELQPDQEARLQFKYEIDVPTEPGRPNFVTATLALDVPDARADGIVSDNVRNLVVPVVAGLPVVFVDTVGAEDEDRDTGEIGETLPLRRLLAPFSSEEDATKQLIRVRHVTLDGLDRETLSDARLVVLAGLPSPGSPENVQLLREYVAQGGQLTIFAGGEFDPTAWTRTAWLDGAGILPAPLDPEVIGTSFKEATTAEDLEPFHLDFDSMGHEYFRLDDVATEVLESLYRIPVFVKAVRARYDDELLDALVASETKRIEEERRFLAESDERRRVWDEHERSGTLTDAEESERAADDARRKELVPEWLAWDRGRPGEKLGSLAPEDLAERERPLLLARYTGNQAPFLLSRRMGHGRVQLFTSGLLRGEWNTLTVGETIFIYFRILSSMITDTLPVRNFDTGQPVVLPARRGDGIRYSILRNEALANEDGTSIDNEMLIPEAIGPDEFGVIVRNALRSGHYTIREEEFDPTSEGAAAVGLREIPIALNGPSEESEIRYLTAADLTDRLEGGNYRWIEPNEEISLEGAEIRGRDTWKMLILAILGCLLLEMLVLALPALRRSSDMANGGAA